MMSGNKRPIEIGDLLKLKRAERPPAEFWSEFDRALRAKQLAALVGRRPWWQTLPRVLAGWRRVSIPIGATAVAAVAFYSLHHHGSSMPGRPGPSDRHESVVAQSTSPAPRMESASIAMRVEPAKRDSSMASPHLVPDAGTRAMVAAHAPTPSSVSSVDSEKSLDEAAAWSSETPLASTLAVLPAPIVRTPVSVPQTFEVTRVVASRGPIEPLQQMAPPGERTRSKMLAALIATNANAMPSRSLERTANRLSEEQLYDQVHRFGAYGDNRGIGGSMKF